MNDATSIYDQGLVNDSWVQVLYRVVGGSTALIRLGKEL